VSWGDTSLNLLAGSIVDVDLGEGKGYGEISVRKLGNFLIDLLHQSNDTSGL
jgi:hypothetical protein